MLLTGGAFLGAALVFVPWQLTCVFGIVVGLMAVSTFVSKRARLKDHISMKVDRITRR